jgi:serine/threonine protein kinase
VLRVTSGQPTSGRHHLAALLPEYSIERELGRGAMGVVHLARHQRLDRLVAVKELQGALAADAATRERFVVEAKALAALNHPHVVPVYDYIERDDHCVLVMEQLPGGTVWDQFVSAGLTMPRATALTLATCSAMQHAHDQGVLHRDIKPENLMFDADGVLKVTDFGIARMVNGASTKATVAGSVLGTPAYMAPEQAEGKHVGPAADVYATATMFYEMLSGRLPFDSSDSLVAMLTQRITSDPMPVTTAAPHVPAPIADVTMSGLARSTSERIASAELFGTLLAEAAVEAWGPAWLDAAGVAVLGSERIGRAARTLRPGEVPQRPTAEPSSGARGTVVAGAAPGDAAPSEATSTVVPTTPSDVEPPPTASSTASATPSDVEVAPDDGRTVDTGDTGGSDAGSPAPSPAASTTPSPTPSPAPAALTPVKPQATDRDLGRAKADQIDQLIDISEVLSPPARPVAQYAIAAILFIAGLAWALVGGGAGDLATDPAIAQMTVNGERVDASGPIEIDLGEPLVVDGLAVPDEVEVSMSFRQFGIPVGTTDSIPGNTGDSARTIDTGFIGNVSSGSMTATVEFTGSTGDVVTSSEFAVTATNAWFLTAAGVISILLILFAVAGVESNLRAFRRGRGGFTSFVGLVVTGGLLGAGVSAALTIIVGTERGLVALVGPAALCALGAAALGLATRANRRRRRAAKQALRHTAIKALASR